MKNAAAFCAVVAALVVASVSRAEAESAGNDIVGGQLRGGYAHFGFLLSHQADDGSLSSGGIPVPGAKYETNLTPGLGAEIGFYLREGFAVSIAGTTPLTTPNIAAGSLTGLGNLGDETVGYYSATAHLHVPLNNQLAPYIGGGLGYMHVFETVDGAVTDFVVHPAFGAVVQFGASVALSENLEAFIDVKRYFLSTTAEGSLGSNSVVASARVDPWIVTSGLGVRF